MSVLNCRYFGFECNYEKEGKITDIVDKFKRHIDEEHHVDYPKEILLQEILRKKI